MSKSDYVLSNCHGLINFRLGSSQWLLAKALALYAFFYYPPASKASRGVYYYLVLSIFIIKVVSA